MRTKWVNKDITKILYIRIKLINKQLQILCRFCQNLLPLVRKNIRICLFLKALVTLKKHEQNLQTIVKGHLRVKCGTRWLQSNKHINK